MAEFQEVMRQRERMCDKWKHPECGCFGCPIEMYEDCMNPPADVLENYEAAIMKWAKEHPEPVYLSLEEWQKENFPDAVFSILPCHFTNGVCPMPEDPSVGACITCRKQPIPAEIAKRLGIPPKGETK